MDPASSLRGNVDGAVGFLLGNVPRLSKSIASTLVVLYLIGLVFPVASDFFALVPAYTIPPHFYVWNVFTAGFFDVSFFNTLLSAITVLLTGRYLEPVWGSREFLKFILVVNGVTGFFTFLVVVFLYAVTMSEALIFSHICGFAGIMAAFTVALKQLVPEQELSIMFVSIRAKMLPGIMLASSLVLYVLGVPQKAFPFIPSGIFFSWVYLRFFQQKGDLVGDLSDSFSFASFFPEAIQPPIRTFSSVVFNILRLCGCCSRVDFGGLPTTNSQTTNVTGSDADAERRRLRALQALDKRMAEIKQAKPDATPAPEQTP